MAYFTKDEYAGKAEYARRKNDKNAEIGKENGLSAEQTDALEQLCRFRHSMHCSAAESMYNSEDAENGLWIDELSEFIDDTETSMRTIIYGLFGKYPFNRYDWHTDNDWYYSVTREDRSKYGDDVLKFREESLQKTHHIVNEINRSIESFLMEIDEKYGTSYCPTGMSRE